MTKNGATFVLAMRAMKSALLKLSLHTRVGQVKQHQEIDNESDNEIRIVQEFALLLVVHDGRSQNEIAEATRQIEENQDSDPAPHEPYSQPLQSSPCSPQGCKDDGWRIVRERESLEVRNRPEECFYLFHLCARKPQRSEGRKQQYRRFEKQDYGNNLDAEWTRTLVLHEIEALNSAYSALS